jgi:hypothetical protein
MTLTDVYRIRRWLLLVLGLAFFYFYSGGGPNQGSRFNLDRAIFEQSRLTIDTYQSNTEDKAFYRGHYYCDKAPGASFVALPALYVTRVAMQFTGIDPRTPEAIKAQMHVATWTAAGIPALLMCLLIYEWILRKGYCPAAAVMASIAAGLASPMWAYATLFWGNALASCCLVLAASSVDKLTRISTTRRAPALAALAGLACGGAVVAEYPTAPMAAVLAALLLLKLRPWRAYLVRLMSFAAGALTAVAVLALYNQAAFGSPFHLGYSDVQGFNGMKQGFFGVTLPSGTALAGILWGPRGLLLTGPFLVFGVLGHVIAIVRRQHTAIAITCLIFTVYPILLNASYAYWDGGWTYGPRHMSAALPFMAMGLAPLYQACRRFLRGALWLAAFAGVFLTMICVSVHGMTPYVPSHPFTELYLPSFFQGRFAKHITWTDTGGPATNFGLAVGLKNSLSVIPFWVAMAVGCTGLALSLRKYETR